uniref:SFRICE_024847 n=1 Tax=Spodoptera frugiperda TaxID=7108 RepID=A0A2H1WXA4_SPOFR
MNTLIAWLFGRDVVIVTNGQGVSGSIPGSSKELLGFFRFFESYSVVARSLEILLCLKEYAVKNKQVLEWTRPDISTEQDFVLNKNT